MTNLNWDNRQPVGEDYRKGGPRGYDGGKKVKGRKRHLLVDTQGLVIKAKVHPADLHDKEGAKLLLAPLAGLLPRMVKVWADSSYQGLQKWLEGNLGVGPRGSKTLVDRTTLGMGA